jgi:hypothetical protein
MKEWLVWKPGMENSAIWSGTEQDAERWREDGYEVEEA